MPTRSRFFLEALDQVSDAVESGAGLPAVARAASRTTWKGSKQIWPSGIAARIARWYSPLMSIETAWIESLRSPSSSKKRCRVALLRPAWHHTIAPVAWSATLVR